LEPSFAIQSVVLTEFGDLLRGYARRGVTVVRNEDPWVQFQIVEDCDGLCDASLVVLPTGLELPLLDHRGRDVTEDTLNKTIHDLTHLLHKKRFESELKVLEALAVDLTARLGRNPDAPRALKKRNFVQEVVTASQDGLLWTKELSATKATPSAKVLDHSFKARELPDGRVLWLRHRRGRLDSEVRLVGESLEGARYELSFHYPPQSHQRVARLFELLLKGSDWPQFNGMTDLLNAVPRSAFGLMVPQSVASYPAAVNSLLREINRSSPDFTVERGLLRDAFKRFDYHLPDFVGEFVNGRSPFFTVIDNGDPAESWCVQAFLDRDLKGSVYAVNALGGSIAVCDQKLSTSTQFRRTQLLTFFKTLAEDSGRIRDNPHDTTGLFEVRRNLPDRRWNDARAYDTAARAAGLCWDALVKEGCFSPQQTASRMRWHSEKLSEGVWAVSIVAPTGRGGWLPQLINFNVIPEGITEVSYSWGLRGIFGGLLGRRVLPEEGGILTDEQAVSIVRALVRSSRGTLGTTESQAFRNISPDIRATSLSSLRAVDPDRDRYDLFKRIANYFKNSW
jgi:hypothetical protein